MYIEVLLFTKVSNLVYISYSDIGTGSTVVLLHGFLENKTMWKDLAPNLSKKNRVLSIDLLGHGQTECLGYVHSMEENAEIVKAAAKDSVLTYEHVKLDCNLFSYKLRKSFEEMIKQN